MADLCVVSETTRFLYPEAKLGIIAGAVSSRVARMPHKVAMEFLLVSDELSAERAYQIGFVNVLVPKGQHITRAQEMAAKIASSVTFARRAGSRRDTGRWTRRLRAGSRVVCFGVDRTATRAPMSQIVANSTLLVANLTLRPAPS
jgi:enoyl-CoA hydratase/carnithine racemase